MKIGLAQIKSATGDVSRNIGHHLYVLEHLNAGDVDFLMFPELSLSNYDPEIVESVAIDIKDSRLDPFQKFADSTGITVGVGAPVRSRDKPLIAIVVFFPHHMRTIIYKSFLHEDELPYFSTSNDPVSVLDLSRRVAVAICYEIAIDTHIESAAARHMDIYLASVAKTVTGINDAKARLSAKAREFNVPVLISNCVGTCEGKMAGGGSMVIESDGTVMGLLNDQEEAILIYDFDTKDVQKIVIRKLPIKAVHRTR